MNSLYNRFGPGNQNGGIPSGSAIEKFAKDNNLTNAIAERQVRSMLNSGQMTQEQFNRLSAMAQQFGGLMK